MRVFMGSGLAAVALTLTAGLAGQTAADAVPADPLLVAGPQTRVVTNNIDMSQTVATNAEQIRFLLAAGPDLVMLQETRYINIEQAVGASGLGYTVHQSWSVAPQTQRASAVLWRESRYDLVAQGTRVGYDNPAIDPVRRHLTWAVLRDTADPAGRRVLVVSAHLPRKFNATYDAAWGTMAGNYQALVRDLAAQWSASAVVTGGDWNASICAPQAPRNAKWRNEQVGLAANWLADTSPGCPATTPAGQTFDAVYLPRGVQPTASRVLDFHRSDHRPVLVELRFP